MDNTGTVAGMHIGTTQSRINITVSGNLTVQINLHIGQIRFGAVVGSGRRIGQRNELSALVDESTASGRNRIALLINADVAVPLVGIVCINTPSRCNIQFRAVGNGHFRTGQQSHILIDNSSSGIDGNADIAVNRQSIIRRIHSRTCQFQRQAVDLGITIDTDLQAVPRRNILLGNITAILCYKHSAIAHELNAGGQCHAAHVQRGVDILVSAGFQHQHGLYILHIVLRQREHTHLTAQTLGVSQNKCCRTTAEVSELHVFIYLCATLCSYDTVANDVTPDISRTAIVDDDFRALVHPDKTHRTGGATHVRTHAVGAVASSMLTADTDSTVDCDRRAGRQIQRLISIGFLPGCRAGNSTTLIFHHTGIGRCSSITGICIIERNQQSNTGRNGVVPGNRAAADQHDHVLAVGNRVRGCLAQIGKVSTTNLEYRCCIGLKLRNNGLIHVRLINRFRSIRQILTRGNTIPAEEHVSIIGSSLQRIALGGILDDLGIGRDSSLHTVCIGDGIAAVFCCQESCGRIPFNHHC